MEITLKELKCAHVKLKALLPRSQTVLGFLWQTLKSSQSDPVKIFVNQWPDFSVVVCKPLCQQEGDSFKDILVFAKDEVRLEEMIRNNVLFDWSKYFCIGTNLDNRRTFSAVASEKHISCRYLAVCNMLILRDMSHLPDVNCAGITLGSLDESHIEMVNRTWKFGQKGSLRMIQNMVRNFPSCCVLDEGGRPVSWVLTYASSAMGMLYTTPEHRGKGYAKVVSVDTAPLL
uniref:Glycine N-acyltransferase-like protein n=1 Tax=Knipowitschia caucasica TaxID=637954 RepID=A0AAV2JR79_KNICA